MIYTNIYTMDFSGFKTKTKEIEEWLGKEYLSLHTGRATPAVLDGVLVESYGTRQPVSHVATISVEDAKTLLVSTWDKEVSKAVEKAISTSDIGLSVSSGDAGIRVSFPDLTIERKHALVKVIKDKLEDARVSVRKEREEVWDDIQKKQKDGDISEDDKFRLKDELQKLVDEANKKLEEIAESKEKDILS